jgi:uncharacterized membrane protein YdbT with pleckstrin-like domain
MVVEAVPTRAPSKSVTERVVFQTRHHPIVFYRGAVLTILALIVPGIPALLGVHARAFTLALVVLVVAILLLYWLNLALSYFSSKFVVTNKRVTMRTGFLSRRSLEVLIAKVESIQVQQGFIERIYRGGSIMICGTGGTKEVFPNINDPVQFQRAVQDAAATV